MLVFGKVRQSKNYIYRDWAPQGLEKEKNNSTPAPLSLKQKIMGARGFEFLKCKTRESTRNKHETTNRKEDLKIVVV